MFIVLVCNKYDSVVGLLYDVSGPILDQKLLRT